MLVSEWAAIKIIDTRALPFGSKDSGLSLVKLCKNKLVDMGVSLKLARASLRGPTLQI